MVTLYLPFGGQFSKVAVPFYILPVHEGSNFSTSSPVYLSKSLFRVKINLSFLLERDGTTDVTRTMHFGTPTAYEKVRENSRGPLYFL